MMGIFTRKRQPDPPPPVIPPPYHILRPNELLNDLEWIVGIPDRNKEILKGLEDFEFAEYPAERKYVIRKHGLYYRPDAQGYTHYLSQAGRFTEAEAMEHSHPNGASGPRDGIHFFLDPLQDPKSPLCGFLTDQDRFMGVPVREVEEIPASASVRRASYGKGVIYLGNSPRARWGRFRSRLRGYRARLGDALAVLRGDMEARDWEDGDDW